MTSRYTLFNDPHYIMFSKQTVGVEPPGTEAQTRMTSEMGVGSQIQDTQR